MHLHRHITRTHPTRIQKADVGHFPDKGKRFRAKPTVIEKAAPWILFLLGFFFAGYSLRLFFVRPTDYVMKWVLMPGVLGGLVLVLSGVLCGILVRRRSGKDGLLEFSEMTLRHRRIRPTT